VCQYDMDERHSCHPAPQIPGDSILTPSQPALALALALKGRSTYALSLARRNGRGWCARAGSRPERQARVSAVVRRARVSYWRTIRTPR
jgi:alkanesulfonate monooxygenase SsuD/methylene tetrahydromethanopterin reductase-like flavin-dependent oxidoreductase (luciferase family)